MYVIILHRIEDYLVIVLYISYKFYFRFSKENFQLVRFCHHRLSRCVSFHVAKFCKIVFERHNLEFK